MIAFFQTNQNIFVCSFIYPHNSIFSQSNNFKLQNNTFFLDYLKFASKKWLIQKNYICFVQIKPASFFSLSFSAVKLMLKISCGPFFQETLFLTIGSISPSYPKQS
jgi:hypothetical protein